MRSHESKNRLLILGLAMTLTTHVASGGQPRMEVTRSAIGSGGVLHDTSGELEISGTLSQLATGAMAGGDFVVAGGFWFEVPPADCNDDGLVSLLDHDTFYVCLQGPGGGIGASPCPCFDVDGDGDITLSDHAKLQAGFTGN